MDTSVHQMPMARNVGCTKGVDRQMEASGFNPSRGPGGVLHATEIIKDVARADRGCPLRGETRQPLFVF
ncbi:MAG: hypothetical protein A3E51_20040 [Burkholderiales bacterium RIFCSPHIGHO2_12_FULL_67_38]|nr:MAG: hypothetical protein A2W81_06380 [Betaproteobacteria bacterium RIFCSPLOWO2_12_61_14]OGB15664.1 MAG: hypothetical protein A3I64_06595 [Burkholderiales bacterium RIFCSPLOWO2_02_FULL_67_64]OGB39146.1 MAG: hypothetical protein A3E51_20040 [Burkholderiales bacterium RIFCSPHIGHO2_12_FULL_67_38]OGB76782.1 MAG: hypothetical protein A3G82_07405 [Burkholderiales bacterium RIFCSPLOWO2_12_FULL_67_210]